MVRKIVFFVLAGVLLFFQGCTNKVDSVASEEVQIRVKNAGKFDYSDVVVNTGGGVNQYGNIAPAQLSEYKKFDFAYPYAFIELTIEGSITLSLCHSVTLSLFHSFTLTP